jgi:hypothetical protein
MLKDVITILASTPDKLKREIASMSLRGMKTRPAANNLFASYAVDVGVYNVGAKGQILASTTTAWARADEGTCSFDGIKYSGSCEEGTFVDSTQRTFGCGRNIRRLVDRIAADIEGGLSISLGLEAPMWFPISWEHCANRRLFEPRCDDERDNPWYLQAGAAATVKAASIGATLVRLLTSKQPAVKLTTDPSSAAPQTIVLYEAFVVGEDKFKMDVPAEARQANNEWDALTASLAWGAINCAFNIPAGVLAKELHEAGSWSDNLCGIASVWQIIASLAYGAGACRVDGPLDCQIVGLTPLQK